MGAERRATGTAHRLRWRKWRARPHRAAPARATCACPPGTKPPGAQGGRRQAAEAGGESAQKGVGWVGCALLRSPRGPALPCIAPARLLKLLPLPQLLPLPLSHCAPARSSRSAAAPTRPRTGGASGCAAGPLPRARVRLLHVFATPSPCAPPTFCLPPQPPPNPPAVQARLLWGAEAAAHHPGAAGEARRVHTA
jgi:hypothetical protein